MAKIIKIISLVLSIVFIALFIPNFFFDNGILLSVTITIGVFTYHFVMRLAVGLSINTIVKNKVNYNSWWYKEKKFEKKLYSILKVKKWKKYLPTYSPETFDVNNHSLEEIASATCQAELIHEVIALLSFLPILLYIPFGELAVFIITSVIACIIDLAFVVLQRYNRPRLIKLIERKNLKSHQ